MSNCECCCDEPVADFDETGLRIAKRLSWVHCVFDATTRYTVHAKRGGQAMDHAACSRLQRRGGVLRGFSPPALTPRRPTCSAAPTIYGTDR